MIKKLKKRFIFINLSILTSIFLAIFAGTYYLMYKTNESQAIVLMQQIAQNANLIQKFPPKIFSNQGHKLLFFLNEGLMRNHFIVSFDYGSQHLTLTSNLESDTDLTGIESIVYNLLNNPSNNGKITINTLPFRYLKIERPNGIFFVFLDRSSEITTLRQLAIVLIFIGCITLIVLTIISFYLASWAIKPISMAWKKQQQFVADASHELKTPLTVIQTTSDVMLSHPEQTINEQQKWLNHIKSETDRMSKLVSDLLYLAKIDNNDGHLKTTSFDLSESIINATLPLESVFFESGKELVLEIESDLIFIGEEERLQQVAIILLDNALKHSLAQTQIILTLIKKSDQIILSVKNKGVGIEEEHLDKIFERFYRVDESRSRDTGGYGLGLSIAQSIVKQHHGQISVKSIPNDETTFTVTLPTKSSKHYSKTQRD